MSEARPRPRVAVRPVAAAGAAGAAGAAVLFLTILAGCAGNEPRVGGVDEPASEIAETHLVSILPGGVEPAEVLVRGEAAVVGFLCRVPDRPVAVRLPGRVLAGAKLPNTRGFATDGQDTFAATPLTPGALVTVDVRGDVGKGIRFVVVGLERSPVEGWIRRAPPGAAASAPGPGREERR